MKNSNQTTSYSAKYEYTELAKMGRETAPQGWGSIAPIKRIEFAIQNKMIPYFPTFFVQGWNRNPRLGGNHYEFAFAPAEGENFGYIGCYNLREVGGNRKDFTPDQKERIISYLTSIDRSNLSEKASGYIEALKNYLSGEFNLA